MTLQKKICLIMLGIATSTFGVKAQQPTADTMAARELRFLVAHLQLSPMQQKELKPSILAFYQSLSQNTAQSANAAGKPHKSLRDLHKEHEDAVQATLSKEQWQRYLGLRQKQQDSTSKKIKRAQ